MRKGKSKSAGGAKRRKTKATRKVKTGKRGGQAASAVVGASDETPVKRKGRARRILAKLRESYGPVDCALEHETALELLVATILSAQSTDANVNRIAPALFAKYREPADYSGVPAEELQDDIRSTGFFRQKTKSIQGACRMLVEQFDGQVPDTMDDLVQLPGVARKTANVVLGTWFGKNEGVVVDTHVGRLACRMGLTWNGRNDKDAVRIEQDLMELLPQPDWTYFSHVMIRHGRQVCSAKKPDCSSCAIAGMCPSAACS